MRYKKHNEEHEGMYMNEEIIPDVGFADNTEQRTPCVLVLDASYSMSGQPIEQLNAGLVVLEQELKADSIASLRVQLLVIRVGDSATIISDWCDAMHFQAPFLDAGGLTALGEGMALALDMIEEQKEIYKSNGISYTRPWIFMISDGAPNDDGWEQVAAECQTAEQSKKVTIFPIGTEDADINALALFSNQTPIALKGLKFTELFIWLSKSASTASMATTGDRVQLPSMETFT